MIAAIECRFPVLKVFHRQEWLSDNGSAYVARQTEQAASAFGIEQPFDPSSKPAEQRQVRSLGQNRGKRTKPPPSSFQAPRPSWPCCPNGSTNSVRSTRAPGSALTARVPALACLNSIAAYPATPGPIQTLVQARRQAHRQPALPPNAKK